MIVIVSPTNVGGVRDYSQVLCDELNLRGTSARVIYAVPGTTLGERGDDVLLQYSGYGFERRGAPLWLLREVRRQCARWRTFGVFFHELYAMSAPWNSAFWLSPVQRYIAGQLGALADYRVTSRSAAADWLDNRASSIPTSVLPVFSTIGEPPQAALPPSALRSDIVVFGGAGLRAKTYVFGGERLAKAVRGSSLIVHDIGDEVTDVHARAIMEKMNIRRHGRLGDSEVRKILGSCRFGLVAYPKAFVAKSSVFAAYCAFGLVPVLFSRDCLDIDGLEAHRHYLPELNLETPTNIANETAIQQEAFAWYRQHAIDVHARHIQKAIGALTAMLASTR
jgi:hypothetical protein